MHNSGGSHRLSLLLVFVTRQQQHQKMLREVIDKQVLELKKLWANKRQLLFQCLNLAMIVFSALMIWKGLMFVTKVRGEYRRIAGCTSDVAFIWGILIAIWCGWRGRIEPKRAHLVLVLFLGSACNATSSVSGGSSTAPATSRLVSFIAGQFQQENSGLTLPQYLLRVCLHLSHALRHLTFITERKSCGCGPVGVDGTSLPAG